MGLIYRIARDKKLRGGMSLGVFLSFSLLVSPTQAEFFDAPIRITDTSGSCQSSEEICGDFVDQDCDGQDLLCTGDDKDLDGYSSSEDCDDTNRFVYPGVSVRCQMASGSGVKTCGSSGAFSACTATPLCEATGGGTCYYVSKLTGSDTNPGTFQQPLRTYKNFLSYYAFEDIPPNRKELKPGDVVYFMSGTYADNYSYNTDRRAFFLRGVHGAAGAPITFKAYPGAHPILSSAERLPPVFLFQSSHLVFEGFEITGGAERGIFSDTVSNLVIRNNRIHNIDGVDNNNLAGVHLVRTDNALLERNIIHDNYDRTNQDTAGRSTENSRNVVLFQGWDNRVSYNVIFNSVPITAEKSGGCVGYKHSAIQPDHETQIFEFDHNILRNCKHGSISSGSFRSRIHHNLILDSALVRFKDLGGPTINQDNIFEFNTVRNYQSFEYNPTTTYAPIETITVRNNIFENFSPTSQQEGALNICIYCDDSLYSHLVGGNRLQFAGNCYHDPDETVKLGLFSSDRTSSQGARYSFSQWQGQGFDTGSIERDPRLDAEHKPQESACFGAGHRAGW